VRTGPSLALLGMLLLAGCSQGPSGGQAAGAAPHAMSIVGLVQDEAFNPIAGANVSLRLTNHTTTTDAGGQFRFSVPVSAYLVDVNATGYELATLTAEPNEQQNVSLNFILVRPVALQPSIVATHFRGFIQCALEALIISPSCDSGVAEPPVGGPRIFNDTSSFDLGLERDWGTVVADLHFEPSANPGLNGLRLVVRGRNDADKLSSYQQYGRFNGTAPFTTRLDPGVTYPEGTEPVPANTTLLRFEVYPQSYGWHDTCQPPLPTNPQDCLLGVATGVNVQFDLYVTVFYHQTAPQGYTLLGGH
jgi:hypothetical protein